MKIKNTFPDNWTVLSISDVLFFQEGPGVRKWQFTTSGVKLLNGGNINDNIVDLSSTDKHISEEEAYGKYSHFIAEPGDLVIACSGIVVDSFYKKIAFLSEEHLPLCMNTSTMRFQPLDRDNITLEYFKYYLQTKVFTNQLQKLITGSAQLNFGPSHIKKIQIPLPPLPTQTRIARALDLADRHRRLLREELDAYDRLGESLFLEMFGDVFSSKSKFSKKKLSEAVRKIQIGPFGAQLHKHDYIENGKPVINPTHIISNSICPNMSFSISVDKWEELPQYHLQDDDVVMGRRGEMGRCAVYKESLGQCICGTGSLYIRPEGSKITSLYLQKALSSSSGVRYLENEAKGVTMMNLNKTIVQNINLSIPPLPLQTEFAKGIKQINLLKAKTQATLKEADDLFNALLQRAFRGELFVE
jgi:type I restriction enzyme S subunit